MGRAEIIDVDESGKYATVVFKAQGVQRKAEIVAGLEPEKGDIGVVIFTEGMMDCILIGVLQ